LLLPALLLAACDQADYPYYIHEEAAKCKTSVATGAGVTGSDWVVGNVFANGDDTGLSYVNSNGGVFLETFYNGLPGETRGGAFDGNFDLYWTNLSNLVAKISRAHPHPVLQTIPIGGGGGSTLSIIFAGDGSFYVGAGDIEKYNGAGTFLQGYSVTKDAGISVWIDLASDQHTIFYVSQGRRILRYDVAGAGAQLPDFTTLPGSGAAQALRLLPPGDGSGGLIVVDSADIKRVDGNGAVAQTYTAPGMSDWFSMYLDPDRATFWAGGYGSGNLYRFNIATGAIVFGPQYLPGAGDDIDGLAVLGEPTAAQSSCPAQ
jgi:hypothetical protein